MVENCCEHPEEPEHTWIARSHTLASGAAASTKNASWCRDNSTSLTVTASPIQQLDGMQERLNSVANESILSSVPSAYCSKDRTTLAEDSGTCTRSLSFINMSLHTPVRCDVNDFGLKSAMLAVACMNQIALTHESAKVGAA